MNAEEYKQLSEYKLITSDNLTDKTPRTLLYGYTGNRDSWHVYFDGIDIITVIYGYDMIPRKISVIDNSDYVPDKRLYPECCDYEFSKLLLQKSCNLPFTTENFDREQKQFYGEIL